MIYGYTWDVRDNNAGIGYYRLTFSLDQQCGDVELNTAFSPQKTKIYLPEEEGGDEVTTFEESGEDSGNIPSGGTAVIGDNVTYIDINIIEKVTGKKR